MDELNIGDQVRFRGAILAGTGKIIAVAEGSIPYLVEWEYGSEGYYARDVLEKVSA